MKFRTLALCAALLIFSTASLAKSKMVVDLSQSEVTWTGSKVVGDSHTGTVKLKSASLNYKDGEPVDGTIVIDMTTIKNTDLTSKSLNKKLVNHLNSDDFFSTDKFKTATFDVKKIKKVNDKFYFMTGDLKIKGKTQPLKTKGEITKDKNGMQTVNVAFDFDRTKFGIRYGSGSFFSDLGDKMINDSVNVKVNLLIKDQSKNKKMANK